MNQNEYKQIYIILNKLLESELITFKEWYHALLELMNKAGMIHEDHKIN